MGSQNSSAGPAVPRALRPDQVTIDVAFDYATRGDGNDDVKDVIATDRARQVPLYRAGGAAGSLKTYSDKGYLSGTAKLSAEMRKGLFLQKIKESAVGKEVVQFNFSGHGIMGTDGKWYMALPVDSKVNVDRLYVDSSTTQSGFLVNGKKVKTSVVDVKNPDFKGNFVSVAEIGQQLHDAGVKQVYGVLGACHSGGVESDMKVLRKLGLDASFLYGAPKDRVMSGNVGSGTRANDFLNQVYQRAAEFDKDRNGQISWAELVGAAKVMNYSEMHNKVSKKGNQISEDVGFHAGVANTKTWFNSSTVGANVMFNYGAQKASKEKLIEETSFPEAQH